MFGVKQRGKSEKLSNKSVLGYIGRGQISMEIRDVRRQNKYR